MKTTTVGTSDGRVWLVSDWPKPPAQAFTQAEWHAISEALGFRLAGPIEFDDEDEVPITQRDYEQAHRKVMQRIK